MSNLENAKSKIELEFQEFHAKNPEVYEKIVKLCLDMKSRGVTHWSVSAAYEIIRYFGVISVDRQEEYKLPNNLRPYYARMIMEQEKELAGFFGMARLRSKKWAEPNALFLQITADGQQVGHYDVINTDELLAFVDVG